VHPLRSRSWPSGIGSVTPRALALALQELEAAELVDREVLTTRPPSTVYHATAAGRRIARLV
jgi:DNA-binding HxlR family transcriptional regulator